MSVLKRISRNTMLLTLCLGISAYLIVLYAQTLGRGADVVLFPRVFIVFTLVIASLKVLLVLTGSRALRGFDTLSLVNVDNNEDPKDLAKKEDDAAVYRRERLICLSFVSYFFMIYLLGFLLGVFLFTALVSYWIYNSLWKAAALSSALVGFTYLASKVVVGGLWKGLLW